MTRRICFKIKSFSSLWSFSVFSYPRCFKGDTERRYYMLVTIEVKRLHIALRAFCLVFISCLFFFFGGGVFSLFLFGCAWDSFGFKALSCCFLCFLWFGFYTQSVTAKFQRKRLQGESWWENSKRWRRHSFESFQNTNPLGLAGNQLKPWRHWVRSIKERVSLHSICFLPLDEK